MHYYFTAPRLCHLQKPFILYNSSVSREPACGGQVEGVFTDDAARQLWTFLSSLRTTPHSSPFFPLPYPPTHPPTSPPSPCLSYAHIHTYTQSRMHRDCSSSSSSSSTARWRSPLRVWVPVPGECRDKSKRVSVMLEWGVWGRRGGEIGVKARRGVSVRTRSGFEAMSVCFFPSSIPITWIFAGCATTTPAVTAPAASLSALPQPVRAAPVAGQYPGTHWVHGWAVDLQGICAILSFAPLICFSR